jgi:hypothetical protein
VRSLVEARWVAAFSFDSPMTPVSPANGILWGMFEMRPFWRLSDLRYLHQVLVIFLEKMTK